MFVTNGVSYTKIEHFHELPNAISNVMLTT